MATNLEPRIVRPRPVRQPKPPSMPRASDGPVFEVPPAQRRSHVRAEIINGKKLTVLLEQRHRLGPNLDGDPLPLGNIRHPTDILKFAHTAHSVYDLFVGQVYNLSEPGKLQTCPTWLAGH